MNTVDFRTKTEFVGEKHVAHPSYWPVALDIGYSSVKGYTPNGYFCFPSYARKIGMKKDVIGLPGANEIFYHDKETDEVWRIGAGAQESVGFNESVDSQSELFGRTRYFSPMFLAIARAGLGFSMMNTSHGPYNKQPLYLQTGLPPAYLEGEDKQYLIEVLSGHHSFQLQTKDKTLDFDFVLEPENVDVMAQPEGTLMSLSMNSNARSTKEARDYLASNMLIADAGFETLDFYELYNHRIRSKDTFSDFGMREVLNRTSVKIKEKHNITVEQIQMQSVLASGEIVRFVRGKGGARPQQMVIPIGDILEEVVKEVCQEVIDKIMNAYDGLENYKYLVLTGGTFAPWEDMIRDYFSAMQKLKVLMGNENCSDTTDLIYTNVRGYYMYMINRLRAKDKERDEA